MFHPGVESPISVASRDPLHLSEDTAIRVILHLLEVFYVDARYFTFIKRICSFEFLLLKRCSAFGARGKTLLIDEL